MKRIVLILVVIALSALIAAPAFAEHGNIGGIGTMEHGNIGGLK